ncbi:putative T7SS-secreted protein [Streptomyces natalensis]|uniref:putative T7SS-secreted protein n=1 Tax=Streptomyces natalensis TaxID=68242 RepID=UPI00068FB394|nr:DUF6531 domain-containing protein [Streptomyces natalensis]
MSWFGDAVNAVGDGAEKLTNAVERGAGEVVEKGSEVTSDALEWVGADKAAHAVRTAGADVAGALGAHVDERQLGETEDPKELIHGDVAKIHESASHLKDFSAAFDRVADGMRKIGSQSHWSGKAADAFREKFDMHPKQWMHAADACDATSKALNSYAHTVSWAQDKAADAIEKYRKAQQAAEHAQSEYESQYDSYRERHSAYEYLVSQGSSDAGSEPQAPDEPGDVGKEDRKAAESILKNARHQRDEAAQRARHAFTEALAHAPAKPEFTELAGANLKDFGTGYVVENVHLAGGFLKAAAETSKLARTVNPMDPYYITHPFKYGPNVTTTLAGLTSAATHPKQLVTGMLGTGWGSDPADATGAFIFNLIGGKGAGGLGKAAARAGAKEAVKSAGRNALKRSADGMRNFARTFKCKVLRREPVDVGTGRMILPQTDIALPAGLPLTFTRTFESSYRAGRWFGPTWSSTADQRLEIDAEGVVLITDEGQLLAYPHPAVGVPTLPADGPGRPLERTPDGDYLLTDPTSGMRWYFTTHTEDLALLDEISDRHGNHLTYDYDEQGAPTAITHSAGYRLLLTTEASRITALHLAGAAPGGTDQLVLTYGYDEWGNLATVTNSSGVPLRFGYDTEGRMTSWTDTNDSHFTFEYDDEDRCTWQSGGDGHLRSRLVYGDPDPETGLRTTLEYDSHDRLTRYQINDRLQVVAETDPTGATTYTQRDAQDRVVSTTDPLGRTTHLTYDDEGRPAQITLPDGTTSSTTYDADGHPISTIGPDGTIWTHTYDTHGNRTSTTDPTGATTTYTHDSRGHLASVTDALGNTTRLYCNEAGLPLSVTDPLGATTHYRRDAFGRVTSTTDPLGETTHMLWTVEGKPAARIDPTGATEEWTYDAEGNRLTHTNAVGQTTHFEYGHFDLLTAQTGPDGVRHEFSHDTELRLTSVTNPQGLTWSYQYDPAGHLMSETDFDNRTFTYTRNAAGQLTARTNTLGRTITYTRDLLGQIVEKNADGKITSYQRDTAGRLLQAISPDATLSYQRDRLGRITAKMVNGRTVSYVYDALGRRTHRTTPTGATSTWSYDAAGNRTTLTTSGHTFDFEHDAAGREITRQLGNILTLANTWNAPGRLIEQSATDAHSRTIQRREYSYRRDGNLLGIDDHLNGPRTFGLDAAGRVTTVQAQGWTETYAYDEAGNQSEATWSDSHPSSEARGTRTYTGTRIVNAGRVRYEHDAQGRITLRQKTRLSRRPDTWRYTWDAEDRLTTVITPDGQTWRYLYDPLGRRIAKQYVAADGSILEQIDFTWDGTNLAEQTSSTPGSSTPITITWDHDGLRPIAQTERKTLVDAPQQVIDQRFFAIITDLVGTPTELVDETGDIAWRTRSTLWGATTWTRTSTAYTPLRFPGQYFDPETELHYNFHRYYDPETARYASPDPLGLDAGPNASAYVHNPHTRADPLGLMDCTTRGGVLQTGGELRRVRGDSDFYNDWAEEAYNSIRTADDVDAIAATAANHGFSRPDIAQIKSHLFEEEHLLDGYGESYTSRFDANPRIAEAWMRLKNGDPHPADIDLLRHERYESNYMRNTGNPSYQQAHQATLDAGHTWDQEAASRDGFGRRI